MCSIDPHFAGLSALARLTTQDKSLQMAPALRQVRQCVAVQRQQNALDALSKNALRAHEP